MIRNDEETWCFITLTALNWLLRSASILPSDSAIHQASLFRAVACKSVASSRTRKEIKLQYFTTKWERFFLSLSIARVGWRFVRANWLRSLCCILMSNYLPRGDKRSTHRKKSSICRSICILHLTFGEPRVEIYFAVAKRAEKNALFAGRSA